VSQWVLLVINWELVELRESVSFIRVGESVGILEGSRG